jgi:disulfide bond formation protein DsbB
MAVVPMPSKSRPGAFAGAAAIGAAAMLVAALAFQELGGLTPCPLCIWQRWPHVAALLLGGAAWALGGRGPGRTAALLGGLAMLGGAGLALYHVGIEQRWWAGPASCVGAPLDGVSTAELIDRIRAAPMVRCDEIAWSFLGLSMAGWNAVAQLGLGFLFLRAYGSSSASQYR